MVNSHLKMHIYVVNLWWLQYFSMELILKYKIILDT